MENYIIYSILAIIVFYAGLRVAFKIVRFLNSMLIGSRRYAAPVGMSSMPVSTSSSNNGGSFNWLIAAIAFIALFFAYTQNNPSPTEDFIPADIVKQELVPQLPQQKPEPKIINQKPSTFVKQQYVAQKPVFQIEEDIPEEPEPVVSNNNELEEEIYEGGTYARGQYMGFSLQTGAFATLQNANACIANLREQLDNTILLYIEEGKTTSFKVLLGAFDTREEASRFKEKAKRFDVKGFIKDLAELEGEQIFRK